MHEFLSDIRRPQNTSLVCFMRLAAAPVGLGVMCTELCSWGSLEEELENHCKKVTGKNK